MLSGNNHCSETPWYVRPAFAATVQAVGERKTTAGHQGKGERTQNAAFLLFVICLLRRVLKYVFSSEFVRLPQTFSNMLFQCVERYVAVLAHLACTIRMMSLHMTKLPELYLTALM